MEVASALHGGPPPRPVGGSGQEDPGRIERTYEVVDRGGESASPHDRISLLDRGQVGQLDVPPADPVRRERLLPG